MKERKPLNTASIRKMKAANEPIAMITAYDYPSAKLAEEAGADIILVGDSLGMVVLGYDSTVPVTMDDMIHHTKAVNRAVTHSFVVADLPFATYHGSIDSALHNAARLMQSGGAKALKLEGGAEMTAVITACVQAGIPIMGHIGLTPQSVHQFGGYAVQGKNVADAQKLLSDAKALEAAGVFAIVLEMVPEELATYISEQLTIPTIGIGAGRGCDGQVLVFHDLLQYASPITPRFVKCYANVGQQMVDGIAQYVKEVKERTFPEEKHVFHAEAGLLEQMVTEGEQGAK